MWGSRISVWVGGGGTGVERSLAGSCNESSVLSWLMCETVLILEGELFGEFVPVI